MACRPFNCSHSFQQYFLSCLQKAAKVGSIVVYGNTLESYDAVVQLEALEVKPGTVSGTYCHPGLRAARCQSCMTACGWQRLSSAN